MLTVNGATWKPIIALTIIQRRATPELIGATKLKKINDLSSHCLKCNESSV
jgi:hypothetical protein